MRYNKQLLFSTMSVQSSSGENERMQRHVIKHARLAGANVTMDDLGNIFASKAKGSPDTVPCVAAHMDTVHDILPQNQFVIQSYNDTWYAFNPVKHDIVGIGGDDKVGVFVALSMLYTLDSVKAAFFVDEEVGCIGSARADLAFFDDVSFVLQCDRRGYGDFVYSGAGTLLSGWEFEKAIRPILKRYGYTSTYGSITDVVELKQRGLPVAAANLSCGYYMPHSSAEYIVLSEVEAVTHLVLDACIELGDEVWTHVSPPSTYSYGTYGSYGIYDDWEYTKEGWNKGGSGSKGSGTDSAVIPWTGTYDWENDRYSWEKEDPKAQKDDTPLDPEWEEFVQKYEDSETVSGDENPIEMLDGESLVEHWHRRKLPCPVCRGTELEPIDDENLFCYTCNDLCFQYDPPVISVVGNVV